MIKKSTKLSSRRLKIIHEYIDILSSERRMQIAYFLCHEKEMSVQDLANKTKISHSAVSQHLGKMRDRKLVACRRDGQAMIYSLSSMDFCDFLHKIFSK